MDEKRLKEISKRAIWIGPPSPEPTTPSNMPPVISAISIGPRRLWMEDPGDCPDYEDESMDPNLLIIEMGSMLDSLKVEHLEVDDIILLRRAFDMVDEAWRNAFERFEETTHE